MSPVNAVDPHTAWFDLESRLSTAPFSPSPHPPVFTFPATYIVSMLALTLTSLATLPLLAFAQDYGYAPAAGAATTAAVMASPVAASPVAAAPAATQTVVVGTSPACSSSRALDRP